MCPILDACMLSRQRERSMGECGSSVVCAVTTDGVGVCRVRCSLGVSLGAGAGSFGYDGGVLGRTTRGRASLRCGRAGGSLASVGVRTVAAVGVSDALFGVMAVGRYCVQNACSSSATKA